MPLKKVDCSVSKLGKSRPPTCRRERETRKGGGGGGGHAGNDEDETEHCAGLRGELREK